MYNLCELKLKIKLCNFNTAVTTSTKLNLIMNTLN